MFQTDIPLPTCTITTHSSAATRAHGELPVATQLWAPVDAVQRLNVVNSPASQLSKRGTWVLQGFTSNVRYAERHEIAQLRARQDLLFEKIINSIHAHAPSAKICFNTNPGDTAEAVNRWI